MSGDSEPLRWVSGRIIAATDDRSDFMTPDARTRWSGIRADLTARYGDSPVDDASEHDGRQPELPGLETVVAVFDLDPLDVRLLTTTAAAHLDPAAGQAVMLLTGGDDPRPTVELALTVAEASVTDVRAVDRFAADSPLCDHGLLTVDGGPLPLWSRSLGMPDHVVQFLMAGHARDPLIERAAVSTIPLGGPAADEAAAAIRSGWPTVWIHDGFAGTGAAVGVAALTRLNLPALVVDLQRIPGEAPTQNQLQRVVFAAVTAGFGLVVVGAELAGADGWSVLAAAPAPLIGVSADRWRPLWPGRTPRLIAAPQLTPADRRLVLANVLGPGHDSEELAQLRIPIADMVAVARYAASLAEESSSPAADEPAQQDDPAPAGDTGDTSDHRAVVTPDLFRRAATTLSHLATDAGNPSQRQRLASPTFADLVLPDRPSQELRRLIAWGRQRRAVRERSTLPTLGGVAGGLAAVFTGPPGTGKTLAAHIVAGELGLELMQVDLSAVVDKYIGETEKKLEKAFREAEARDAVLFFDEADALFGSRSEVKNAHDRYANQEIAYLLQRVDQFDGICLLATNLRGHLDAAFTRRMHFVIAFGEPDEATRRRLWTTLLGHTGPSDPDDPVDVDDLAAAIELTGGDLRNIVLSALFDAAADGGAIGMRHVRTAAVREYAKLGRRPPPGLDAS